MTGRAGAHNRRARAAGAAGRLVERDITGRWHVWGGCCYVCRRPAVELDHVKPLAVGGANLPANIRPICLPCHRRKTRGGAAYWREYVAGLPCSTADVDRADAAAAAVRERRAALVQPVGGPDVMRRAAAALAVPYRRRAGVTW